MMMIYKLLC